MKAKLVIDNTCIDDIVGCFTDRDEVEDFLMDIVSNAYAIVELHKRGNGSLEGDDILRVLCAFAILCRENIELVRGLIKAIKFRRLTDSELKDLLGE